jgi:hypothetical protein
MISHRSSAWLAIVSTWAALASGCAPSGGLPADTPLQTVGSWRVGVRNDPEVARVGENTLIVVARDASGKPMHGSVEVIVGMPAMGSMPYMESRGKAVSRSAGVFRASYGLAMGGEWDVTIRLRPQAGPPRRPSTS